MSRRRITLAYPWTDADGKEHRPDETISVDEATARRLIGDGWARPASAGGGLDGLTVAELTAYAAEERIDLAGARKRDDVLARIRTVQAERLTHTTVVPPTGGQTT